MKKYGKKWRKLEAEKKIERERIQAKAGEPFSSVRKKKILCTHYVKMQSFGYLSDYKEWYSSLLKPISKEECMCSTCKKRFPIEKCAQMEKLLKHLSNSNCVPDEKYFGHYSQMSQRLNSAYFRILSETEMEELLKHLSNSKCVPDKKYSKLSQGLEPVYYRRLSETEIEISETVEISEVGCRFRIPFNSIMHLPGEKGHSDVFLCTRRILSSALSQSSGQRE